MIITLIIISSLLSIVHYLNAEWILAIIAGLPTGFYLGITALLIMIRLVMALSKLILSIKDLYNRFLRLTNNLPNRVVVNNPAPNQIGKPRKFSTSARRQAPAFPLQKSSLYLRILDTVKPVGAMAKVKFGRPLINHLIRLTKLAGLDMSQGLVKVIIVFCAFCFKHIQKSGITGLIIYLKACTVILQQASGRHKLNDMSPLKIRFARSKSGFPRIIPDLHRRRILRGDTLIIKFWMTLFSLYRVLEMPYKLKLSTITDPSTMDGHSFVEFSGSLEKSFWTPLSQLPGFDDTKIGQNWLEPLDFLRGLRATPFIISKSSSSARVERFGNEDIPSPLSTSPAGILAAVATWYANPNYMKYLDDWCKATGNQWLLNRIELWRKALVPMYMPHLYKDNFNALPSLSFTILGKVEGRNLGRLGFKEEAAGKLRVFAFVDPFTQWLLKPLHNAIFEILDLIPQDGTTDQLKPVKRLIKELPKGTPFFSFDLSAATDRLPILLQMQILTKLMTAHGAQLWSAMLIGRAYDYFVKINKRKYSGSVRYATGQPMGALSSWAMLAFTHHAIVQIAAGNSLHKPGEWFNDYALLGDDIVIANAIVAEEYRRLMNLYGVEIGLAKSLISLDGSTLEFAKRTYHHGKDVSPVPFSEYWVGRQMLSASLELCRKYELSLAKYLDLFGFGYKAKGSSNSSLMKLGQRLRHRILAYYSPFGPNPMSLSNFFSLKGLTKYYSWTERKIQDFIQSFISNELIRIQDKLDSPTFKKLEQTVKDLSTVNKDREYYGAISRSETGARKYDFQDLYPEGKSIAWGSESPQSVDKEIFYHVVDSLNETVYREAFLDVLVSLRELRYAIEDGIKARSGPTLNDLEKVVRMYYEFQDTLNDIPLPKEIYVRVEKEAPLSNLELIKQWERYSRFLRSTLSTARPLKGDNIDIVTI